MDRPRGYYAKWKQVRQRKTDTVQFQFMCEI